MSTPAAWATKRKLGTADGAKPLAVNSRGGDGLLSLTLREIEILEWVAAGKRDREIAQILKVSYRTVQKHVQNLLEKLRVETRGAAAAWWYEQNR